MVSNERTFKYLMLSIQIFDIFPFLSFILAIRYFKIKNANLLFIFFSVVVNVILRLSRTFESVKHHLWMRLKFFFYYDDFCKKRCYDLNDVLMNVLQESINYFSSGKPSFIVIFIINHKTPTMAAQQFYK